MNLTEQIEHLYAAAFNRPSDADGLAYWVNSGWSVPQIAAYFAASPEFTANYGALTDDGFVRQLYENILGRAGEQAGVSYWDNALANGSGRGDILNDFAQSPENIARVLTPPVASPPPIATTPPVITTPPVVDPTPPTTTPPPATPPDTVPPTLTGPPMPDLSVTGFLTTDTLSDITRITVGSRAAGGVDGQLVVGNLVNVGIVTEINQVGSAHTVPFSRVEVQAGFGDTLFELLGTIPILVIDHPNPADLGNAISFGTGGGRLELGDLAFDGASYAGTTLTLTNHGAAVYSLTDVTGASSFTVGHDAGNGFNTISPN